MEEGATLKMFLPRRNYPHHRGQHVIFFILLSSIPGAQASQVSVPQTVSAVLGKNVTLGCSVEVGLNLSLTQSTWERRLATGPVTVAVFNPVFGISVPPEYAQRLSFRSPSRRDATVVLRDVGFADAGVYTCKVATFPLGNTQASTTVSVLVEPKVYVSAGSVALVAGGNETVVATCVAERARPPAEVSWESGLPGRSETRLLDQANGTTSTQVRYLWTPSRPAPPPAPGPALTCVVRHPALLADLRIPYRLHVQFAPDVSVEGYDADWYAGRESVQLTCNANANPPAHHFRWIRLDGDMPEGVALLNNTLLFLRPLQKNDSGVYRCEAANAISLRSTDLRVIVQDPPTTSMPSSSTPVPVLPASSSSSSTSVGDKRRVLFTSPTLAALPDGHLGSIVGGAVGGALFLLLLLSLGGVCYLRQQQSFRGGDYLTKPYPGPPDMQKPPEQHELHRGAKPAPNDYGSNRQDRDREEWGGRDEWGGREPDRDRKCRGHPNGHNNHKEYTPNGHTRAMREAGHHHGHPPYSGPHQTGHARYAPPAAAPLTNGAPYLSEDCYDSGPEGDYVSHMDGSVISRREWYV